MSMTVWTSARPATTIRTCKKQSCGNGGTRHLCQEIFHVRLRRNHVENSRETAESSRSFRDTSLLCMRSPVPEAVLLL